MMNRVAGEVAVLADALRGRHLSAAEWRDYLLAFHRDRRGDVVPFETLRDSDGKNSYEALAAATPRRASRVLEIGCGDGALLPAMLAINPDVQYTGLDLSADQIARATERFTGERWQFATGDIAAHMPLTFDKFDVVVSHLALLLADPLQAALDHVFALMVPGGTLAFVTEDVAAVASEPIFSAAATFLKARYPSLVAPLPNTAMRNPRALAILLRSAGFEDVDVEPFTVAARVKPGAAADFILSCYVYGSLDDDGTAALRGALLASSRSRVGSDGCITLRLPLQLVTARRA